jgi:FixJ family two-component response regulator
MITMPPVDRLVFIVDDDEAVRDSLELLLEAADHSVQAFEAAADARAACRARLPTCIVTDVRMPKWMASNSRRDSPRREFRFR